MHVGWVKIDGFRQITGSMSKTVQVDAHFLLKSNRKSYALYLNLSNSYLSINVAHALTTLCVYMDGKVTMVFNRNVFKK